jgi:hypothetical protein
MAINLMENQLEYLAGNGAAVELGRPIPDSPHAVSVALPHWQDVIGYEEKRPEVMHKLASGYPRFLIHPLVLELGRQFGQDRFCLPFPSARAARLAADFVQRTAGTPAQVLTSRGMQGVVGCRGWRPTRAAPSLLKRFGSTRA